MRSHIYRKVQTPQKGRVCRVCHGTRKDINGKACGACGATGRETLQTKG